LNQSNWIWVWASKLTNSLEPINYNNWGLSQSQNFSGDSVYVSELDFKFYVGLSSVTPIELARSPNILCESYIKGLKDNQMSFVQLRKTQAFTDSRLALGFIIKIKITL
jgi:hypothetical protein